MINQFIHLATFRFLPHISKKSAILIAGRAGVRPNHFIYFKHKKMYAKRHLNYLYVYCLRHGVILQISIKPQLPSGSLKLQQSDSTEILSIFQLFSFPFLLNLSA